MTRRMLMMLLLGVTPTVNGQALPRCSDLSVKYSANPPELAAKIHVRKLGLTAQAVPGERQKTPQGTGWLVTEDADYVKNGPWDTRYFVGHAGLDRPSVELEVDEHGNTIHAMWINEELLFVQVWWGHLGATDLILNVGTGEMVYSVFGQYGDVGLACRE